MKVLIDTNVVLDLLLQREPFVESTFQLFRQIEEGRLEGYVAATTITNIFYIIRKAEGREVAITAIQRILTGLNFCQVDRQVVETSLSLNLKDFEDSIQLACATLNQLEAIITRDHQDFTESSIPVYTPMDLLAQL